MTNSIARTAEIQFEPCGQYFELTFPSVKALGEFLEENKLTLEGVVLKSKNGDDINFIENAAHAAEYCAMWG